MDAHAVPLLPRVNGTDLEEKAMTDYPYLPLWTDNYLADTRHLTTKEHGAYLLLLMTAWRSHDCTLPDDDRLLARFCSMGLREWIKIRPTVLGFFEVKDGKLLNSKLIETRSFASSRRDTNRVNGMKGGLAKALKYKEPILANATIPPDVRHSENVTSKLNQSISISHYFDEWWNVYPRKVGKSAARQAFENALNKIQVSKLIKATKEYAAVDVEIQYQAYPATWLNQERWTDDTTHLASSTIPKSAPSRRKRGDIAAVIREIKA